MHGIVEGTNWFCFNDLIQDKINSLQNYSLYPYLQYAFVSWHFCFASLTYPALTYPQKQYEVSQKLLTSKQIFNSLKKGIDTNLHGIGSASALLLDTIGLLKIIINPEIRSVSMHLLTQKEKDELQHTVEIIADFGLTLNQLQSSDGTYTYKIDPDIDFLTLPGTSSKQTSYWSKQIIAQEVQVEKMRRSRPKLAANDAEMTDARHSISNDKKSSPTSENKTLPNFLQKLIPKSIKSVKPTHLVCKDFFGRVVTKSSVTLTASQGLV
jgi:chromosome transmission fidelity protein 18